MHFKSYVRVQSCATKNKVSNVCISKPDRTAELYIYIYMYIRERVRERERGWTISDRQARARSPGNFFDSRWMSTRRVPPLTQLRDRWIWVFGFDYFLRLDGYSTRLFSSTR